MKILLLLSCIFLHCSVTAQTPYLSVVIKMDSVKTGSTIYKMEMKICELKNTSNRGDWLKADTSKIDFDSLQSADISCGKYFDKGMPEVILGREEKIPVNQFKYTNQVFAWEKILVFRISDQSSRGPEPEMYIVFPVKYKSFITSIELSGIEFQSGKLIFVDNLDAMGTNFRMTISAKLNDHKTTEVKDSPLKTLLEE